MKSEILRKKLKRKHFHIVLEITLFLSTIHCNHNDIQIIKLPKMSSKFLLYYKYLTKWLITLNKNLYNH